MDLILIIAGIALLWFIFGNKKQTNDSDSHLSETQKRWRAQNSSSRSPEVDKTSQMNEYILRNKRPFRILEWILSPVDSRLVASYIANIGILFFAAFGGWFFFGFPVNTFLLFMLVLFIDFMTYNRKLVYEVTIWNPEFQEKFMKD